ncbi:MAG: tRNA (adenosine(37)-N6)-threonylcarbamoyltransferase complex dimerization subunit type 1 TsaB [Desulfobacteraceae bacterium]|nr:MAG: tRNA (adenosine(37)-N6)-threonylcarbamoyltransferase complex dimerization subunit type 1 TsaB [Desulfobacteraceae bacterium]
MLLAFNSSTFQFSTALLERDGSLAGEIFVSRGKGHFGGLMPAVQFLLTSCGSVPAEIEAVAAAIGPGSFTGLRTGLSAAKGFSHALGIPIFGIPTLHAMALQSGSRDLPVVVLIDSRRNEFFAGRFLPDGSGEIKRLMEDTCLPAEKLPSLFEVESIVLGNDFSRQWPLVSRLAGQNAIPAPRHLWKPGAACVGDLALKRLDKGDPDDPDLLSPIYLRPPDIRPNPYPVRSQA